MPTPAQVCHTFKNEGNVLMDDQQNHPQSLPDAQGAAGRPALDPKGAARRRFTRLGAGATGVILTLHSQPGMAGDGSHCVTPSGFMSIRTTSASRTPQGNCSAHRSHGYWKNHPDEWETLAGIASGTKFGTVLAATGNYEGLAEVTLMDVLQPSHAIKAIDHGNVAMQTVTALLNARAASYAGLGTVLPESLVVEIWTQFAARGFYSPSSGAYIWNGELIVEYFESTFR